MKEYFLTHRTKQELIDLCKHFGFDAEKLSIEKLQNKLRPIPYKQLTKALLKTKKSES